MFTDRQLATLLAALWYWREEMCSQHAEIQRPYFACQGLAHWKPLSSREVLKLARLLKHQLAK